MGAHGIVNRGEHSLMGIAIPGIVLKSSLIQRPRIISQISQVSHLIGDRAGKEPGQLDRRKPVHTDSHISTCVWLACLLDATCSGAAAKGVKRKKMEKVLVSRQLALPLHQGTSSFRKVRVVP